MSFTITNILAIVFFIVAAGLAYYIITTRPDDERKSVKPSKSDSKPQYILVSWITSCDSSCIDDVRFVFRDIIKKYNSQDYAGIYNTMKGWESSSSPLPMSIDDIETVIFKDNDYILTAYPNNHSWENISFFLYKKNQSLQ